jgi:lipid-binding SYLF domain-containing protein
MQLITASRASSRSAPPAAAAADAHTATAGLFATGRRQKALELGLLVLAIAVAAGVIWGIVRLAFPRGTALGEASGGTATAISLSAPPEPRGVGSAATPALPDFQGTIARIRRTVQMRASSELAWSGASVGRAVHTDDAIQTLAEASAVIKVKDQGDISIGENSLVVFEATASDAFLAARTAVASVTRGALTGHLKSGADSDALGIRLPNATVRLQGAAPGQAAAFDLRVNRDQSASIVILQGKAQVRARNGLSRLASGEGIQISADGRRADVQSIPGTPALVEPAADQVIVYHKARPAVLFRWQSAAPVDDYRFVLARDRDFRDTLVDEHLTDARYTRAGLDTGDYYWRVTARHGWLESSPTDIGVVHVERDIDARVRETLAELYRHSGAAKGLVDEASGVLVFPSVIKGGIFIGAEYGEGALLSRGRTVDYYALKSASLGLQMGGQTRKVVVLFMTPAVYDGFLKSSGWKVGVDGSITVAALSTGNAIDTATAHSPVVGFVFSSKGLMYNLTLEGSKISRLRD